MLMQAIARAYYAENFPGSSLTAPLRCYEAWFHKKMDGCKSGYRDILSKIYYVVVSIFAYLTLGLPALVGLAMNFCLIPPETGYSLWARWEGLPKKTEEMIEMITSRLLDEQYDEHVLASQSSAQFTFTSSNPWVEGYVYAKMQILAFSFCRRQEKKEENAGALENGGESSSSNPQTPHTEGVPSRASLPKMETSLVPIENTIRTLSQKLTWCPEQYKIDVQAEKILLGIPIPDQIPFERVIEALAQAHGTNPADLNQAAETQNSGPTLLIRC